MRTFIAGLFNYRALWLMSLYAIRRVFVPFLGLRQGKRNFGPLLTPATVPMQVGKRAAFFTVQMAEEERDWIAGSRNKHLTAALGVVVEPLTEQRKRLHVLTIVHHHNWAGPVYLRIIKPFHHAVVNSMVRAGVKRSV